MVKRDVKELVIPEGPEPVRPALGEIIGIYVCPPEEPIGLVTRLHRTLAHLIPFLGE